MDGLPQGRFAYAHPDRPRESERPARKEEVSRRRRGLDGALPEKNGRGSDRDLRVSFAFPTDAAVSRVFYDYTTIREFLPDAIGGGKVAALADRLPFRD